MKIAFSFCIYGHHQKYCQGLVHNLNIIQNDFPECFVYIYVSGKDVPQHYIDTYQSYPFVLLKKNTENEPNMIDRFFVLDDDPSIDIMIVRDADSRIHSRDQWCIQHFISSSYIAHTIRDHGAHRHPIMGGLWGLKRDYQTLTKNSLRDLYSIYYQLRKNDVQKYHFDMDFLRTYVYPLLLPSLIIYLSQPFLHMSQKENIYYIPFPIEDSDFCGQVIDFDEKNEEFKVF